jgi:hypothetical protein
MAIQVSHWQRRDGADRNAFGQAAFDVCRATRAEEGVDDSRFYWVDPDTVVIQTTAKSAEVFGRDLGGELAGRFFALADLARQSRYEQWIDPRTGQASYEQAGR